MTFIVLNTCTLSLVFSFHLSFVYFVTFRQLPQEEWSIYRYYCHLLGLAFVEEEDHAHLKVFCAFFLACLTHKHVFNKEVWVGEGGSIWFVFFQVIFLLCLGQHIMFTRKLGDCLFRGRKDSKIEVYRLFTFLVVLRKCLDNSNNGFSLH